MKRDHNTFHRFCQKSQVGLEKQQKKQTAINSNFLSNQIKTWQNYYLTIIVKFNLIYKAIKNQNDK